MNRTTSHFVIGLVCILVGGALALFAKDVTTPVITLSKVGVVLLVLGAIDILYGVYLVLTKKK